MNLLGTCFSPLLLPDSSTPPLVPLLPPYQLYEVKILIRDNKTCKRAYRKKMPDKCKNEVIFEDVLCVSTLGRGLCFVSHWGPYVTFPLLL